MPRRDVSVVLVRFDGVGYMMRCLESLSEAKQHMDRLLDRWVGRVVPDVLVDRNGQVHPYPALPART